MEVRSVRLVVLDEFGSDVVARAAALVGRVLGVETVKANLPCEDGFDAARRQWRAEALLRRCVQPLASPDTWTVGLTSKDLYVPSLNFVFGLALSERGVAIVSSYRLGEDDEDVVVERIAKETIHEVGHLAGAAHCNDPGCVMWFSNTLAETDRKAAGFCADCKSRVFA